MIARLRGEVLELNNSSVVLDVQGVGYEVFLPESVATTMPAVGEAADLYVRQVFREDAVSLFGFLTAYQRQLFDLLTDVKGCGPKIALALLGQVGESSIVTAIVSGDTTTLAKASGVGPRLAERILVELKNKVGQLPLNPKVAAVLHAPHASHQDDELLDALMALGYRRNEAEIAAKDAGVNGTLQDRLRMALRVLAR